MMIKTRISHAGQHHLQETLIFVITCASMLSLISTAMAEMGWVEGTVTDASSHLPIEGAAVTINGYVAFTNASGVYRVEVSPGTYNVTVEKFSYGTQRVHNVSVPINGTVTQDFSLNRIGWIEGNVTDVFSGLPLEGAAVTINGYVAFTNGSGFYRFAILPGTYNVTVEMKDYVTSTATGIQITANMTTTQDFDLLPFIESSDDIGNPKDTFNSTDQLYIIGFGYSPSTTYALYVVEDVAIWINGMTIPPRVAETVAAVISDSNGYLPTTLVWTDPLAVGKYDIVVDVDNNSVYDDGIDYLDNNDIEVTAGFSVIPESPSALLLPLFMIATLLSALIHRRDELRSLGR